MDSNAGNCQNKGVKCEKCGCIEDVKDMEDFNTKLDELHRLRKYIDFSEAMVTAIKKLDADMKASDNGEVDPIVSRVVKDLLADLDHKAERSDIPSDTDGSAVVNDEKRCQFVEKMILLDNMVKRVERLFSRKTVRNLTKLFDQQCQAKMTNFQIDYRKLERTLLMAGIIDNLRESNDLRSRIIRNLEIANDKLVDKMQQLSIHGGEIFKKEE